MTTGLTHSDDAETRASSHFPLVHALYGRLERLEDAPFLTAQRLVEFTEQQQLDPTATEFNECPQCYFQTSGTSGKAKRVPFSEADMERVISAVAGDLAVTGVDSGDVVWNLGAPPPSMAGWGVTAGSERLGAMVVNSSYLDYEQPLEEGTAGRVTVVVGTPMVLLNVGEQLAAEHGDPAAVFPQLRLAVLGGDALSAHVARRLEALWKLDVRMLYASVEGGTIGVECAHGGGIHLNQDDAVLELLPEAELLRDVADPSVSAARYVADCAPGTRGELVISKLGRELVPLVRYRTGDVVELEAEGCPCGNESPRVRVLGRAVNMIKLGDGVLHEMQLDQAVSEAFDARTYQGWRARVSGNGTPQVRLDVTVARDGEPISEATARLGERLADQLGVTVGEDRLTVSFVSAAEETAGERQEIKARRLSFEDR